MPDSADLQGRDPGLNLELHFELPLNNTEYSMVLSESWPDINRSVLGTLFVPFRSLGRAHPSALALPGLSVFPHVRGGSMEAQVLKRG